MMMRFLPVNLNALLVELRDLNETLSLFDALRYTTPDGVEEMIPAARTLLVRFNPHITSFARLAQAIAGCDLGRSDTRQGERVMIPVDYQGEDLPQVAELLGISVSEVIARHTGNDYMVAFTGFAPGFAYLSGGENLNVPRRNSPRPRIPAGAVALAGLFSGVYPQESPGGWQLIGTTPLKMWDLARDVPALLQPGSRVTFCDNRRRPVSVMRPDALPATAPPSPLDTGCALVVNTAGLQTLLQDAGRPGLAGQGISASGAMDKGAMRRANRLVGNAPGTAVLEIVQGGLAFQVEGHTVMALAGAPCPVTITRADGAVWQARPFTPIALDDGDTVTLGIPSCGVRSYLAVRGGFAVTPVMGSLATDTLARLGPEPLRAGTRLPVSAPGRLTAVEVSDEGDVTLPVAGETVTLDVVAGPRTDWFTDEAWQALIEQEWQVTLLSDRVGLRLQADTPLARAVLHELPSEGTCAGSIQVPPNGQPVLFAVDHPLTGGYPVIGCVAAYHLDLLGQLPVNARIRFRAVASFSALTLPADAGTA